MNDADILEYVNRLKVWQRHGERAPHKPLLLLLALGRLTREQLWMPFEVCDRELRPLLEEFGPSRSRQSPEYPFWHLQNDGLWEVDADEELRLGKNGKRPTKADLVRLHARGRLKQQVVSHLKGNSDLIRSIGNSVLHAHFPESLHQDILDAVGLTLDTALRKPRDPKFRQRILDAYSYRCAVCGLDMRMRTISLALEAAHIKWHQAGGPDVESNGLALCSTHHKVFDLGAFTINESRILVSELIHGGEQCEHVLLRHHGRTLRAPVRPSQKPNPSYLEWHRREVFKERARPLPR